MKKAPQFSFGYRDIDVDNFELRPGPGAYDVNDSFLKTSSQSYKSLAIPRGERFRDTYFDSQTPGPGTYKSITPNYSSNKIYGKYPLNSTGPRGFNIKRKSTSLGPGAYNIASNILKDTKRTRLGVPSSKSDRSTSKNSLNGSYLNNSGSSAKGKKGVKSNANRKEIYIDDKSLMLNPTPHNKSKFDSFLNESHHGPASFAKQKRNFSWLPKLNTPGPGDYDISKKFGIEKVHNHYTISNLSSNNLDNLQKPFKKRAVTDIPGPGQYHLEDESFDRISRFSSGGGSKGFTFKKFTKSDDDFLYEASLYPGPGSFSLRRRDFFERGPKFTTSQRPGGSVGGPGPGSYTVFSENSFKSIKKKKPKKRRKGRISRSKSKSASPARSDEKKRDNEKVKTELVMNKNFLAYSVYGKRKRAFFLKKIEPPKKKVDPKKSILSKIINATTALKLMARFDFSKKSIKPEPALPNILKPAFEIEKKLVIEEEDQKKKLEERKPKMSMIDIKKSGRSFGSSIRNFGFLNLGTSSNPSPGEYDIDRDLDKKGRKVTQEKRKELFEIVQGPGPGSYSAKESSFKLATIEKKVYPKPRGLKLKIKKEDTESSVGSSNNEIVRLYVPEKMKFLRKKKPQIL